jgi:hypothetical protein
LSKENEPGVRAQRRRWTLARAALWVLPALAMTAGCASQNEPGYYNPPAAGSLTDSQTMASGADYRPTVRAPSQLQFDLKPNTPLSQTSGPAPVGPQGPQAAQAQPVAANGGGGQAEPDAPPTLGPSAAAATTPAPNPATAPIVPSAARLVPQPQTYAGTLPCFGTNMDCTAQHITLTLAPNGRWRGRSNYLQGGGKPLAEQGCWDGSDDRPPRVYLLGPDGNTRAEFAMSANNVLTLRIVNGVVPNLAYTLTRQPDLDPINELAKTPAPRCGPEGA